MTRFAEGGQMPGTNCIIEKRDDNSAAMILQMGPQHPSTHGVLRLEVTLDGEIVTGVRPHVGYLHRCAEKLGERDMYSQTIPHTDRMDYIAAMTQNLAVCEAIEKLIGLEVPLRAKILRVLLSELQRIASHQVWLGTHVLDLGAITPFWYCFEDRELIQDIFEEASGARLTYSYIRVGGFVNPPTERFFELIDEFLIRIPARVDMYEKLLTNNPIFINRLQGVGVISGKDAIAFGLSGPVLRGSGVVWDLRVSEPYAAYDSIVPRIAVRDESDCYARYLVRIDEMRESIRLCKIALKMLDESEGEYLSDNDLVIHPPKEEIYNDMAAMIRHWILAIRGFKVPAGEVYHAVESPRGELGVFISSDGTETPYRIHYRSPCFVSLSALQKLAKGRFFSDLVAIIGSLDVVLGEIDR